MFIIKILIKANINKIFYIKFAGIQKFKQKNFYMLIMQIINFSFY